MFEKQAKLFRSFEIIKKKKQKKDAYYSNIGIAIHGIGLIHFFFF